MLKQQPETRRQRETPAIDLFSLYVLFSYLRPRDATRGNSFFQLSSYARANLRITNEKNSLTQKAIFSLHNSLERRYQVKVKCMKSSIYSEEMNKLKRMES